MNFINKTVLSVYTSICDHARDLRDTYTGFKNLEKPTEPNDEQDEDIYEMETVEYTRMRSLYINNAVKPLSILLSASIAVILLIYGFSKLAVYIYARFLYSWHYNLGFRLFIIFAGAFIAFGFFAYILGIIKGRQIKQKRSEMKLF